MIKVGQIWIRRRDDNYLPEDSWKVRIEKADRNGITYKVIEYNGEKADGVQITASPDDFKDRYYQERGER
jgi:hypothetical protein